MSRPRITLLNKSIGEGASGQIGLCHFLHDDGTVELAVAKQKSEHELAILKQLKATAERQDTSGIPALLHADKETMYISACELGSLADQSLLKKVEAGKIPATTYYAYLFQVIEQVASALHYTHHQGVIHLDVKPENIFLAADGRAYLGDFGNGAFCEHGESVAMGMERMSDNGTAYFITPEMYHFEPGQEDIYLSAKADMWALGATLGLALGEVHEVGLMKMTEVLKLGNDKAPMAMGAIADEKFNRMGEWKLQCLHAVGVFHNLTEERSSPLTEKQLLLLLKSMATLLTAPPRLRPSSDRLLAMLSTIRQWVPRVEVKTERIDGRLMVSSISARLPRAENSDEVKHNSGKTLSTSTARLLVSVGLHAAPRLSTPVRNATEDEQKAAKGSSLSLVGANKL